MSFDTPAVNQHTIIIFELLNAHQSYVDVSAVQLTLFMQSEVPVITKRSIHIHKHLYAYAAVVILPICHRGDKQVYTYMPHLATLRVIRLPTYDLLVLSRHDTLYLIS